MQPFYAGRDAASDVGAILRGEHGINAVGANVPAVLRNISARGLQIEGEVLPPRGTFVGMFVEGLNVPPGEIVWSKDNLAGIELFEELSWTSIIPWIREIGRQESP